MTLRELAARLGLGKTTVADALRGRPGVSETTRTVVLTAARELGYVPNPLTSALMRQMRGKMAPRIQANVTVLIDSVFPHRIRITEVLCEGFRTRANVCGLAVDEFNTRPHTAREVMRILRARGVEGVAIFPMANPRGHRTLDWSEFSSVCFGYSMVRPRLHRVVHDHFQGMAQAYRMCRKKGFQRIGLVLDDSYHLRANRLWLAAYLEIQHQLAPASRLPPFLFSPADFDPKALARWQSRVRPEVILTHRTDPLKRLPEAFLDHPRPAIPVLMDYDAGEGRYAGIRINFNQCGVSMCDLLVEQLVHNQRGIPACPSTILIEGRWVDHPSLVVSHRPK